VTVYEPRPVVNGDATADGSRKSALGAATASANPEVRLPSQDAAGVTLNGRTSVSE
jgi:hypothetical protein